MYKVMIVDDESTIREGLKTLIPWEAHGFHVAKAVKDGRQALEAYGNQSYDLLVVDIRMPGMDGLELIETIRKRDPAQHFLILSGYADFEYAKRAMQKNVDDYLLKPIDEEELLDYLQRLRSMLEKESKRKQWQLKLENVRAEALIRSVIAGDAGEADAAKRHAHQAGLDWPNYQIVLLSWQGAQDMQRNEALRMKQRLKSAYEKKGSGIAFTVESRPGLLLRNGVSRRQGIESLRRELRRALQRDDFFAAAGEVVSRFADIEQSYQSAQTLLRRRFLIADKGIVTPDTVPEIDEAGGDHSYDKHVVAGKLYYAVDIGNKTAVRNILTETVDRMIHNGCLEATVKTDFVQIVCTVLNKLARTHEEITADSTQADWIYEIHEQLSIRALERHLNDHLGEIIDRLLEQSKATLVKRMTDFIERNYQRAAQAGNDRRSVSLQQRLSREIVQKPYGTIL